MSTHCRRRSWCGLKPKQAMCQLQRKDARAKSHTKIPYLLFGELGGSLPRPIVEDVDQLRRIRHPGNRKATRSAWPASRRRVVVGGRRKQRTIQTGPNDDLCRPGCKVVERWDSCGKESKKDHYLKGRPIKMLESQFAPFLER